LLPIVLEEKLVEELFSFISLDAESEVSINLQDQVLSYGDAKPIKFELDEFRKFCLLEGLDEIGLTLEQSEKITSYEQKTKLKMPWLF